MAGLGCGIDASASVEAEDETASLYAALWDEAPGFSGPR
jgi:hypothetical protein